VRSKLAWVVVVVCGLGVVLRFVSTTLDTESLAARGPGEIVLTVFSLVTAIGAGVAVWFYWKQIKAQLPGILEAGGALVVLVGGMIARTVMSNLDAGQPPLDGGWWHWLRPLLVSPIVFGSMWFSIPKEQRSLAFLLYSAFVNGYFWQSVLEGTRV
jgi:heme/copper-type cytochrome/quinol oxidase subunit 2